jgi:hypothetical protein
LQYWLHFPVEEGQGIAGYGLLQYGSGLNDAQPETAREKIAASAKVSRCLFSPTVNSVVTL